MLVADTLLVDPHSLYGQYTIFLLQPAGIKLVIRNQPVEPHAQRDGQEARKKEDGFPWCNGRPDRARPYGNAVCDQPAEDLSPAVEGEPDVDAGCLFVFGVPLQQLSALYSTRIYLLSSWLGTWEVMRAKPGVTAASKTPRRNRIATAPGKLCTTAKRVRMRPHATIQKAEYLARGSRCSRTEVGYSHARYPTAVSSHPINTSYITDIIWLDEHTEVEHAAEPLVIVLDEMDILLQPHHAGVG